MRAYYKLTIIVVLASALLSALVESGEDFSDGYQPCIGKDEGVTLEQRELSCWRCCKSHNFKAYSYGLAEDYQCLCQD
jgi:hypothetical protein